MGRMSKKFSAHARTNEPYKNVLEGIQTLNRNLLADQNGFARLSNLLTQLTGIHLPSTNKNQALMANRLSSIISNHGLHSYDEYFRVIGNGNKQIQDEFISALTTHTTQFFRESPQISLFKEILPDYLKYKEKKQQFEIRLWCAASSTGQEPYTLAMTLREVLPISDFSKWNIKMLATDISSKVLKEAYQGVYSQDKVKTVNSVLLERYFDGERSNKGKTYQVKDELKRLIVFRRLNLMDEVYPFKGPFDFIFCRNVLIYFDLPTQQNIIAKLLKYLAPGGYLFTSHSENIPSAFRSQVDTLAPAVYRKIR